VTREVIHAMRRRAILLAALLSAVLATACAAELGQAPFAIGFAVGVPCSLPVDWSGSLSLLTGEALLSQNLTVALDLATYPASFPNLYEGSVSLLVKAWLGAASFFGGGGLTERWHRVGSDWVSVPHLNLKAGFQAWFVDSLALQLQVRSVEALPVSWELRPELTIGMTVAIGRARPPTLLADGQTLWILVGLGVAAMIAFLPRS
jgi:ABC-type amino acid transport substrate-binding protein